MGLPQKIDIYTAEASYNSYIQTQGMIDGESARTHDYYYQKYVGSNYTQVEIEKEDWDTIYSAVLGKKEYQIAYDEEEDSMNESLTVEDIDEEKTTTVMNLEEERRKPFIQEVVCEHYDKVVKEIESIEIPPFIFYDCHIFNGRELIMRADDYSDMIRCMDIVTLDVQQGRREKENISVIINNFDYTYQEAYEMVIEPLGRIKSSQQGGIRFRSESGSLH